jgi:hypothetical protein
MVIFELVMSSSEGVAPEPLDGVLLRVVLGDPQRLELVGEEQVEKAGKPSLSPAVVDFFRRSSSIF